MSLQAYKEQNLNTFPDELEKTIPPLKNGERAVFRSLKKVQDYHPVTEKWGTLYPPLSVGFRDTIKFNGQRYSIGIPNGIENNAIQSFKQKTFGTGEIFNGIIVFIGGNLEDEEMYTFFMLSNFNKDNPNRDTYIQPLWEKVDTLAESKNERKYRSQKADALNIAAQLNLNEVREWVAALNQDEYQDEETLRNIVEKYAEDNPALFLSNFKSPVFKLKTVIRRAADKGFILFDAASNKVKWADAKGTAIVTIEDNQKDDWVSAFAEYCNTSNAGDAIIKGLKKKIKEVTIEEAVSENS